MGPLVPSWEGVRLVVRLGGGSRVAQGTHHGCHTTWVIYFVGKEAVTLSLSLLFSKS